MLITKLTASKSDGKTYGYHFKEDRFLVCDQFGQKQID